MKLLILLTVVLAVGAEASPAKHCYDLALRAERVMTYQQTQGVRYGLSSAELFNVPPSLIAFANTYPLHTHVFEQQKAIAQFRNHWAFTCLKALE